MSVKVIASTHSRTSDSKSSINLSLVDLTCKSAVQHELEVQASRILYIFDKAIQKIQIVACLPRFLAEDAKFLRKFIKHDKVEFIKAVCSKYKEPSEDEEEEEEESHASADINYAPAPSMDALVDKVKKTITIKVTEDDDAERTSKVDPDLSQSIDNIFFSEPLRCCLEKYWKIMNESSQSIIRLLKILRQAAEKQLTISADQEKAHEQSLKTSYRENKDAVAEIKRLKEILNRQRSELGEQIREKNESLDKCLQEIEYLQQRSADIIKKRIADSEKIMMEETAISEVKQVELEEESKRAVEDYNMLLEGHLVDEKILRAKQGKVEITLSQWLAKYDNDIGERQATKEDLTKEYNEDKAKMKDVLRQLADQEDLYYTLMAEKEEEEYQIDLAVAWEFNINRAAKIIQACWRAYKYRKMMRKKAKLDAKRNKGKKKEVVIPPPPPPIILDDEDLFDDL